MSTPKTGAQSGKRIKKWWIKERYNPQLGTYYVACGQLSAAAAKRQEKPLYSSNMMSFDSEEIYKDTLTMLRVKGQKVQ